MEESRLYSKSQLAKIKLAVPVSRLSALVKTAPMTFVVLGMHRSGTSMVAGVMHRLGVNMGDRLMDAHNSNPLGHFEDLDFYELNEKILTAAGGSWDQPPLQSAILAQGPAFTIDVLRVLQLKQIGRHWGWKDPRTVLTLKLFQPYLVNPRYIICHRPHPEVASSLVRRDGADMNEALKLSREYSARLRRLLKNVPENQQLHFDYEKIRQKPLTSIMRLAMFCGTPLNSELIKSCREMVLGPEQLQQAKQNFKVPSTQ